MSRRQLKHLPWIGLLSLSLTCSNLDNIEVSASGETTIEGSVLGDLLGPLSFVGFDGIDISESQEFQNGGYTKDDIDSVRLKVFTLSVTEPADGNFDFLSKVSFFAEAEGLPRVEIARLDPVPEGQSELEMEILDVELQEYAIAPSMTITTEATGVSPSEDTTIDAEVRLDVDVNVSGQAGCSIATIRRPLH
jgi:hypothetical protein